jgi:type IV secretory pathway TrbD component
MKLRNDTFDLVLALFLLLWASALGVGIWTVAQLVPTVVRLMESQS